MRFGLILLLVLREEKTANSYSISRLKIHKVQRLQKVFVLPSLLSFKSFLVG